MLGGLDRKKHDKKRVRRPHQHNMNARNGEVRPNNDCAATVGDVAEPRHDNRVKRTRLPTSVKRRVDTSIHLSVFGAQLYNRA